MARFNSYLWAICVVLASAKVNVWLRRSRLSGSSYGNWRRERPIGSFAFPVFRSTRRTFHATPYPTSGYWGHVIRLTKEEQPDSFSPVASCVCAHLDSGTMSNSVISVISRFLEEYTTTTPNKLKVVDAYLLYILLTGALQFLYCLLVGTFPFNSFLSGFISCVGAFILAGELNDCYVLSQTNVKISFDVFLRLRNALHKTEPVCKGASMSS